MFISSDEVRNKKCNHIGEKIITLGAIGGGAMNFPKTA